MFRESVRSAPLNEWGVHIVGSYSAPPNAENKVPFDTRWRLAQVLATPSSSFVGRPLLSSLVRVPRIVSACTRACVPLAPCCAPLWSPMPSPPCLLRCPAQLLCCRRWRSCRVWSRCIRPFVSRRCAACQCCHAFAVMRRLRLMCARHLPAAAADAVPPGSLMSRVGEGVLPVLRDPLRLDVASARRLSARVPRCSRWTSRGCWRGWRLKPPGRACGASGCGCRPAEACGG
jgi:hypothetical protein